MSPLPILASCLTTVILSNSCRPPTNASSLEYAHSSPDKLIGSPPARLEISKSGIRNNLGATLSICVQRYGKNNFSDDSLILESKLAHAIWLNAAGYRETDFAKFSFVTLDKCQSTDNRWSAVIVLADLQKEASDDKYASRFAETSMSCGPKESNSYSCQSDRGITLGWGGPGAVTYSYFPSAPQKWTEIRMTNPSTTILSPYVDWQSLSAGIDASETLSSTIKSKLKIEYSALMATQNPSLAQLVNFGSLLAQNNLILGHDLAFTEIMNSSANNRDTFTGKVYRPKLAAFHTLLHEIGHTFGLEHADNPAPDAITGQSATTTYDDMRKQYVTKISTMGYGEPYAYLTEDDQAGVRAAAAAIQAELASHR